jgi:UDP-N-acetylglucosamine kinase
VTTAPTPQELRIQDDAIAFAKANRKAIAKRLTADTVLYPPEEQPVAVYMAGSPGAGKTEASIELIANLGGQVLRIDPDELRHELPGYTGENAWLFQRAVSVLVDRILDTAFDQSQSFLLDGTLTNYDKAVANIERALRKRRAVQVLYVYQEPKQAWAFVKAREAMEDRRIEPETFISQYFAAREVVHRLKRHFDGRIRIDLLLKNTDGSNGTFMANVDQIDSHIPEKYDVPALRAMLGLTP